MSYIDQVPINTLVGKIVTNIQNVDNRELIFTLDNEEKYKLHHEQDCCEQVRIQDITGNLDDLIGSPILMADESSSKERPVNIPKSEYEDESQTWTFYKFGTIKGYVDIRWIGESNGYYSESVEFEKVND